MRRVLITIWLLILILLPILYLGPGQKLLAIDQAEHWANAAQQAETLGEWGEAQASYDRAQRLLSTHHLRRQVELSLQQSESMYKGGHAADALKQLESLYRDQQGKPEGNALAPLVLERIASMSYLVAWRMRLEGAKDPLWMDQAERARQCYRLLAESADQGTWTGSPLSLADYRRNLETVIELERMDIRKLRVRGMPPKGGGQNDENVSDAFVQMSAPAGNEESKVLKKSNPLTGASVGGARKGGS